MNDKMFYENISKQMQEDKEKIKRLEDNWNKLKEWLYRCIEYRKYTNDVERWSAYKTTLEKMEELEKGDSNE